MNEENPEEPQVNEEEQPQREPSTFEQFKYVFPNTIRFYFFALESPRARYLYQISLKSSSE